MQISFQSLPLHASLNPSTPCLAKPCLPYHSLPGQTMSCRSGPCPTCRALPRSSTPDPATPRQDSPAFTSPSSPSRVAQDHSRPHPVRPLHVCVALPCLSGQFLDELHHSLPAMPMLLFLVALAPTQTIPNPFPRCSCCPVCPLRCQPACRHD